MQFKVTYLVLFLALGLAFLSANEGIAQSPDRYNVVWTSQSKNSSESMPCGGGSIGLNVWVENDEVIFYMARSGSFDENNALLKAGRVRLKLSPNPFGPHFKQELDLISGAIKISSGGKTAAQISVWVDVNNAVIHVEVDCVKPLNAEATYENWRYQDRLNVGRANNANSYKWAPQGEVKTLKDEISFQDNGVVFYHENKPATVFDVTVRQQGLDPVKDQMLNPLFPLVFGGRMEAKGMRPAGNTSGKYVDTDFKGWKLVSRKPAKKHELAIYLHTSASSLADWKRGLQTFVDATAGRSNLSSVASKRWWKEFWDRSFIITSGNDTGSIQQAVRNYNLMRYMLACNAYGDYPTKFNGGLFTYDPSLVDSNHKFTPDFRNWGGGTHTAQNQRLVYFPMIRSGDFDMMEPQFEFYRRMLSNAELRSRVYWNHDGACFTEQLENFGLPNPAEYGWKRPVNFDKGFEYNAWLEYQWDTVLEFCLMILETERYAQADITGYLPLIESCLQFFDKHYQYLSKQRGSKALDGKGHLVLYPGSAAETYKMAYNASSTIAALKVITERVLQLPEKYISSTKRKSLDSLLKRIPPISYAAFNGQKTIAPAKLWERINNTESPQLYPVFPWGIYGIGRPDLDVARNTYLLDTNVIKFRSHVGWKQDNIFAARLGFVDEAARLTTLKLKNSGRRFPAFWGPGFDWTPDHNWGGSGMIGLQEMLLQTDGEKIYLFPAWPKKWDVRFKLHAPYQTTVECVLKNGKVETLKVVPATRTKDIVNLLEK